VDPQHTFPVFEVSHYGFSLQRGRFNRVSGTIVLDPAASRGSIDIAIDATSLDMGLADWDEKMKSAEFFATARHPRIAFHADTLIFDGERPVRADGTLTLLGIGKPVSIAIDKFHCGQNRFSGKSQCGADATALIRRSDFGMTSLLPGVGDEVRILISVEATRNAQK
jgi:polyisoprenoid-binding protein YceI